MIDRDKCTFIMDHAKTYNFISFRPKTLNYICIKYQFCQWKSPLIFTSYASGDIQVNKGWTKYHVRKVPSNSIQFYSVFSAEKER